MFRGQSGLGLTALVVALWSILLLLGPLVAGWLLLLDA